jgi:hypothetical protein
VLCCSDCIELVKNRIVEAGWATAAEIKAIEKDLRAFVDSEFAKAKKGCVCASALAQLSPVVVWCCMPTVVVGVVWRACCGCQCGAPCLL